MGTYGHDQVPVCGLRGRQVQLHRLAGGAFVHQRLHTPPHPAPHRTRTGPTHSQKWAHHTSACARTKERGPLRAGAAEYTAAPAVGASSTWSGATPTPAAGGAKQEIRLASPTRFFRAPGVGFGVEPAGAIWTRSELAHQGVTVTVSAPDAVASGSSHRESMLDERR